MNRLNFLDTKKQPFLSYASLCTICPIRNFVFFTPSGLLFSDSIMYSRLSAIFFSSLVVLLLVVISFSIIPLMILTGKNCVLFNSVQEWLLGCFWSFHMFTQSIKFYTFHYYVFKSTDVWKMWFIKQTLKMNGWYFQHGDIILNRTNNS